MTANPHYLHARAIRKAFPRDRRALRQPALWWRLVRLYWEPLFEG